VQDLRDYLVSEVDRLTESARAVAFKSKYDKRDATPEELEVIKGFLDEVSALKAQIEQLDADARASMIFWRQLDAL
jgi:hypothetical protein